MTVLGWTQIVIFVVVLTALTPLLGGYMARVYQGRRVRLSALGETTERLLYRLVGVDRTEEHDWKAYARSALVFSCGGWLVSLAPTPRTVAVRIPRVTRRRGGLRRSSGLPLPRARLRSAGRQRRPPTTSRGLDPGR